ncbi:J domain-containing protein [Marinomonas transparens]|uniref:DnaJ domain-containing protein n=1 Tax=Marinomonas transparens TaxID=2795388 RepID=A0A934JVE9_9GAMM|nr:J domain-containing protein [Marinomonas transparens]MBJ7538997.1 DnaJ domain-containing protein [Marinomonas transparens]
MSLIDDYQLLEIPTSASEQDAKSAFRRLARRYHPDKNPDIDTTEHFQRLQAAYQNVQDAIKQGMQVNDWKPYSFTQAHTQSRSENNRYHASSATDKEQKAFIKERQRAYEEMKRNSMQQEKTRNDAIKSARNTLNEKRVKAIYEEAFKSSKNFTSQGYTENQQSYQQTDIPPYQSFVDHEETPPQSTQTVSRPIRLYAAKAAFRAATYIACFAAGIYTTLYWQSAQQTALEETLDTSYIRGLYPQFRTGTNYSLTDIKLYAEPDLSTTELLGIPMLSNLQSIKMQGDWLTVRYQGVNGWVQAKDVGFGSAQTAIDKNCLGQPGVAPRHGQVIGNASGKSRLRILNQLQSPSMLRFESFDGQAPFSIYLNARQAYAANYIPRGRYRLVLETGSLYHHACNQFLFNDTTKVILENVDFAGTEQTLTLKQ